MVNLSVSVKINGKVNASWTSKLNVKNVKI